MSSLLNIVIGVHIFPARLFPHIIHCHQLIEQHHCDRVPVLITVTNSCQLSVKAGSDICVLDTGAIL